MQGILDFIDFIVNTVKTLWGFFTGLVEDLILFFKYLATALKLAFECITTLPVWLQMFGYITIGVCLIYLIIGRDAGKSS